MYIRLFESGPGYDSIELNIRETAIPKMPIDARTNKPIRLPYDKTEMYGLIKVITALFDYTDIEEIGIGRERDAKVYKKKKDKV